MKSMDGGCDARQGCDTLTARNSPKKYFQLSGGENWREASFTRTGLLKGIRTKLGRGSHIVFSQASVEGSPAHAQQASRLGTIAPSLLQCPQHAGSLILTLQRNIGRLWLLTADFRREIFRPHHGPFAMDQC